VSLTVLICTHNRAELLSKVLGSLNEARRPRVPVEILVIANNCSDATHRILDDYRAQQGDRLPLRWIAEPTPGKSHALNTGIPATTNDLVAFVDDDHRIDANYLVEIERAGEQHPEIDIFCGRILPDWSGAEPNWVHDEGPYRIYPLPVPRYDQGDDVKRITADEGPVPGGGNLVVRRHVFELAGQFSTELGPTGHDLGGGEDSEYVIRALRRGAKLLYWPGFVQYHYVDLERLTLSYIVRKGYQRTRSTARLRHVGVGVPLFAWRKLLTYLWHIVFALSWQKRRFYLVRCAASLGEIRGMREASRRRRLPLGFEPGVRRLGLTTLAALFGTGMALSQMRAVPWHTALPPLSTAAIAGLTLLAKSLFDFSQTGPGLQRDHLRHYRSYVVGAVIRLSGWAFVLLFLMAAAGSLLYHAACVCGDFVPTVSGSVAASLAGMLLLTLLQFTRKLLYNPGLLVASMHYRVSRLYPLWRLISPARLATFNAVCGLVAFGIITCAMHSLWQDGRLAAFAALAGVTACVASVYAWSTWTPEAAPSKVRRPGGPPNILMVGSDTLRADRLNKGLTPNIDRLRERGTLFSQCFVPCARTAPSLVSLLTGTWPQVHGIRDNFVSDTEARLPVEGLPALLARAGYRSAAVSDWCGADMGKFDFGFDHLDLPTDQWNLKYLIRQGPKDLRLFVSLFVHNRLGRMLLPELYYMGGVPLTTQVGRQARWLVSALADAERPFMLNAFFSTTHPPFASEYPWYTLYSAPGYAGESKFAMARLTDPFDIIRRQAEPREEFDLEQILHLYDGCVAQFDHELGLLLTHLERCGLANDTVVVVYSDHGMEFFEHGAWGQGNSALGDFSSRIPLIVSDPRHPAAREVSTTVRSIDLAPTLLEIAGVTPPATMNGSSLAGILRGTVSPHDHLAYNETGIWLTDVPGQHPEHLRYPGVVELLEVPDQVSSTLAFKPEYRRVLVEAKDRAVIHGRWKLVYQPLVRGYLLQLYDTLVDPDCLHDVFAREPDVAQALAAQLQEFLRDDDIVMNEPSPNTTDAAS
jgi:arylsulfatase A-like enzyme/glycosyltransferase involved in cell wall biosynthesis